MGRILSLCMKMMRASGTEEKNNCNAERPDTSRSSRQFPDLL